MAEKNFLLLSLDDERARKVANIVGNESCKKILEFLTKHEGTESELSKNLGIPMPTVHYNLQQLMDAGLVVADTFHYSKRGREVNHYRLANKYIIITPTRVWGIKEKLRSILPVVVIIGATAVFIHLFQSASFLRDASTPNMLASPVMEQGLQAKAAADTIVTQTGSAPLIVGWFLGGAALALVLYAIFSRENTK